MRHLKEKFEFAPKINLPDFKLDFEILIYFSDLLKDYVSLYLDSEKKIVDFFVLFFVRQESWN